MSQSVEQAVQAARQALAFWSAQPLKRRVETLVALAEQYTLHKEELAEAIVRQTFKPRWEARAEVDAMIAKAAVCIDAYAARCTLPPWERDGIRAVTRFRPHGVAAVLGPFNMPGHLPNGHIMPALLAGNTIVFKPSEHSPLIARQMAGAWQRVADALKLGPGIFNLVEGSPDIGQTLAAHPGVDALFFTGSKGVGLRLSALLADQPQKILALEMGGNNPLIVHEVADVRAAAALAIQSAFLTAGQRCSCARRLILCRGPQADALVRQLIQTIGALRVGMPDDVPEPFMGPVISPAAAGKLLDAQADLRKRGAVSLVEMKALPASPALLSPGLLDVSGVSPRDDVEHFGPLLQLIYVDDFEAALNEANATRFGLSAGLISDSPEHYEKFLGRIRAGVIAWNRPMTGASSRQPFGGVGLSGNHRPGAFFAADYCATPVAALESDRPLLPAKAIPGLVI
jgi:succinylglutamic semialdehyde dehydrogenase